MMLQGHSEEVTSLAWCPTDFTKVRQQTFVVCQRLVECFPAVKRSSLDGFRLGINPRCSVFRLLPVLMTTLFGSGGFTARWTERNRQWERPTLWAGRALNLPQVSIKTAENRLVTIYTMSGLILFPYFN